jgi:DNA-binding beta-propeller fold protein YncE
LLTSFRSTARLLGLTGLGCLLASCAAGTSALTPAAPGSSIGAPATATASASHPDLRKGALLYVSNNTNAAVYVYSYPSGKLTGRLTNFTSPTGECVDGHGNVWIADAGASQLVEYAHGGKTPIATLQDTGESPNGCAVDPKTGNLAVTNYDSTSFGPGSVSVYKKAAGNPTTYMDTKIHFMLCAGYDNKGNLFVDGSNVSGEFGFAELQKGKQTLTDITLDAPIMSGGSVQWDGKHMTVADEGGDLGPATIYQIAGSKTVGSTVLEGTRVVFQSYIDGNNVIAPDYADKSVKVFAYPDGGAQTDGIGRANQPFAAVVSRLP